jgi:hypothetical protein
MYLHPWDVMDEGTDVVLRRIKEGGMTEVNLATSYHAGRYFLPHNPKRKVFSAEEGVVYFRPQLDLYKRSALKPRRSVAFAERDVLQEVLDKSSQHRMKVNSWTVVFHNSVFATSHPDLAVRNAFGDSDTNRLCPNAPDVRNYLFAMVKDLATNYNLSTIILESIGFPGGVQHGNHHETLATPLEPLVSELLATCFCDHCKTDAQKQGIDLEAYRKRIEKIVELSVEIPQDVLRRVSAENQLRNLYVLSQEISEIKGVLEFKAKVVSELLKDTRQAIRDSGSKCSLTTAAYGILAGEPSLGRGAEGILIPAIKDVVDAINFVAYTDDSAEAYYLVKWAKYESGDCPLLVALRSSHPVLTSRESVVSVIKAAVEAGADGLQFYNYGWTPLHAFGWIKEGLRAVGSHSL